MKAVGVVRILPISDPASLVDLALPTPSPASRDLLVRVRAVSINPADSKVRQREHPSSPRILGWDAAGVVVGIGSEVSAFQINGEVYFAGELTRAGTNSELCLIDERIA